MFLFLSLLAFLVPFRVNAASITLRPAMKTVALNGAPQLNETPSDADVTPGAGHIDSRKPYAWITPPGPDAAIDITVDAGDLCDRALFTIWDWDNRPVYQSPFAAKETAALRIRIEGVGGYLLTLDGLSGKDIKWRRTRSIAACVSNVGKQAQWSKSHFQVGLCTFPGRQSWTNSYGTAAPPGLTVEQSWRLDAELTARTGVQLVRPDIPTRGEEGATAWIDTDLLDAYTAECARNGIKLDLQIGAPPPVLEKYAKVTDPAWRYPRAEAPYRRYVHTLVSRYGKYARFIEVWNEPDNLDFWRGTPEEFITQHRWAMEEIRKVDPAIPIAPGGYCMMKPEWTPVMAGPIGKMTDWFTYHSHGDVNALRKTLTNLRAIVKAADAEKQNVVNTEMGWAAWRLDMERMQAATGMQKLLECWAEGHRAALLYASREIGGPRMRKDPDWGYLYYTFCPRFAYAALCAFIDTYKGAKFDSILMRDADVSIYRFKRGEETLISVSSPDKTVPITLQGSWSQASLVDPMGNRSPLPSGAKLSLTASQYPVTVVLTRAGNVEVVR